MDDKETQEWDKNYEAEGLVAKAYGVANKLELRKIKFFEAGSEETNCFVAEIYKAGKRVGHANNDGHGGDTLARMDVMTDEDHKLLTRWVDDTFEESLNAKELARINKWIDKNVTKMAARGWATAVLRQGNEIKLAPTKCATTAVFIATNPGLKFDSVEIRR